MLAFTLPANSVEKCDRQGKDQHCDNLAVNALPFTYWYSPNTVDRRQFSEVGLILQLANCIVRGESRIRTRRRKGK